ncbi:MAG: glucose-6-phosphate isomerase [Deltaproteobacteria bacterium]|jgi:glucose-6-phosphate isomerase|nr:glucose-6-phosphate isomerase [Deltaproteobacteria bacterium]
MEIIKLDISRVYDFISADEIKNLANETASAQKTLYNGDGDGNDFLGWLNLPSTITDQQLTEIESAVSGLKEKTELLVVVGIGGSYLGARAVNDALTNNFAHLNKQQKGPHMLFAGHNIGEDYMHEMLEMLDDFNYTIVVISKSGTTTEPAIAFRILKDHLVEKVGKAEAGERIIAVTDSSKGALRLLADEEGYRSFIIPDDVGGRFSVLTPVGLIPLAICGVDIRQLVEGAKEMSRRCDPGTPFEENPAAIYAATRNALYRSGKKIEILVNYHNKLHYLSEWWKQLFSESEGKEGKGIYPSSVDNSTDLHSMGQYIQEGERFLFETVISVEQTDHQVKIPGATANLDQLNYLATKNIDHVNKMAELGTILAHLDGGVPNIRILDYIDHAGNEYADLNLRGEIAVSNPLRLIWLAVNKGTGGAKPDFFIDMIMLFRQLRGGEQTADLFGRPC